MKKHIRQEVLKWFLIVTLSALVFTIAVSEFSMQRMNQKMKESTESIGKQASDSSSSLLLDQALSDAGQLARDKSEIVDKQLNEISKTLTIMQSYLEDLYVRSENILPQTVYTAEEIVAQGRGKDLTMQYALSPEMTLDMIQDDLYLQGNLEVPFHSIMQAYPTITSIYTGDETGFTLGYDTSAESKASGGIYFEVRDCEWYKAVKQTNELYIMETYTDSFGRGLSVTMAMPYSVDGEFRGVIALDISIDKINEDILSLQVGENGYAMLFSGSGSVISATGLNEDNKGDLSVFLGQEHSVISEKLKTEKNGTEKTIINGSPMYVLYDSVSVTGWKLAIILPENDIVAPALQAAEKIEIITAAAQTDINNYILMTSIILAVLFVAAVIVVVPVTFKITGRITNPLTKLMKDAEKIGEGNLNYESDIHTGDEIEGLSNAFESMTKSLKKYIDNLAHITAEKERIGAELDVATKIQSGMLPCIFPPFPNRKEFDIFAFMKPAKEVGGDFYDFFLVDDDHLALVIADVSGKGVPAALFMVIAKTLIKNSAQFGNSPSEVFETVNNQLCENNEAGMFVTAFMGIYEISTGKFTYVNAGHNPPLIKRKDGEFDWLETKPGFVLAGLEGISYKAGEVVLNTGDSLYMYTDGVTEAENPSNELYSDPRLKETLNRYKDLPSNTLLGNVMSDISRFASGAEQSDDITMLAIGIN